MFKTQDKTKINYFNFIGIKTKNFDENNYDVKKIL
jgi:hypothetical protein